jgi:hypothetical protein
MYLTAGGGKSVRDAASSGEELIWRRLLIQVFPKYIFTYYH